MLNLIASAVNSNLENKYMLVYTIVEYTNNGTQGVKTFLSKELCDEHFEYLEREFYNCDFEVITSFCSELKNAEECNDE